MEEKLVFAQKTLSGIIKHFIKLTQHRTKNHKLIAIVFITMAAVDFVAEDWNDIKEYGKEKEAWLKIIPDLPFGIPSQDAFNRVI